MLKGSLIWEHIQKRMHDNYHNLNEERERKRLIDTLAYLKPVGKVLDVGCYDCRIRKFLPDDVEYRGIDPIDLGLADVDIAKAELMPYDDEVFDTVYMISTFDHLEEPKKVIDECQRVLKKGGIMCVVQTIEPDNHIKKYTKKEVVDIVSNNFGVVDYKIYPADTISVKVTK